MSEAETLGPLVADELYDYQELRRRTGIKRSTAARMVHRKQIPHVRLGGRLVRFSPRAIERWIQERSVAVAK